MARPQGPNVYSIPVHRNFADALATGLIAQHRSNPLSLARTVLIVPNQRAARAVTDAFVRRAEQGLLLPRLVVLGDVGEDSGAFLDDGSFDLPPAVAPMARRFILARLVQQAGAFGGRIDAAEALHLADTLAETIDALLAAEVAPHRLREIDTGAHAAHWEASMKLLGIVLDAWPGELARLGCIDAADRRNRLLSAVAARWAGAPPPFPTVAAGITTSAPAVVRLLSTISRHGQVVLPGVDLVSPDEEWDALVPDNIDVHPQHHLRLLLDGMSVNRSDVKRWHWGDGAARDPDRSRVVSNAFAPARFTTKWHRLAESQLSLKGVRQAEFATPGEEAQAIAIALRSAIEEPGRTAALVTPDRALAERVIAHLKRWGIDADDSAGVPLSVTPAGALLQAIAEAGASGFAPVPLLALLKHPLVSSDTRMTWRDGVRRLDRKLRGPRPAPGLAGMTAHFTGDAAAFWADVQPLLAPLEMAFADPRPRFLDLVEAVRAMADALAGEAAWAGAGGRAAAMLLEDLAAHGVEGPLDFDSDALVPLLRHVMDGIAVRPPQGGHPRIAIWGLLEARLQSADLLILGGLNEGVWPALPSPDPWLAPMARTALGLGGLETRIGLAAHDLASALGGPSVLMTRAARDARSPTIASRFWLRLAAMTGGVERDGALIGLSRRIDHAPAVARATQPAPVPTRVLRPRDIWVTDVDRLKADPFAFYAKAMLRLRPLDPVDALPDARWRGTQIHDIIDGWTKSGSRDPEDLRARLRALLADSSAHPMVRTLWGPRVSESVDWVLNELAIDRAEGREIVASEVAGQIDIAGVTLHGRADRIDRLADGTLAIVDYKTGKAPPNKAVEAGFSMQLGLLGLIAERGGMAGIAGTPLAFEYWSLAKYRDGFGKRSSPVRGTASIAPEAFTGRAAAIFAQAAEDWLTGDAPFTAKLKPEYANYDDYDQLTRRDEWYGRER